MSDLYNTRIKLKRDTEENWTSKNPILLDGEMIIVKTNDGKIRKKIGDGVKKFSELPYDEITIDSAISTTSTNPVQNKVITLALDGKAGTAVATTSANGLMSNADKAKLDGIELGANKTTVPTALKNPNALTIEIGNTTVTYDGSTAQTVMIADGKPGAAGADGVTPHIGDNGNWYVGSTDTGKPSRGATGAPGKDGADGKPGATGADGITPHIGDNGNWYIGDDDTGKPSRGEQGPGAEVFYIDLAGKYPSYTCPVAMADIKAAYEAGKELKCRFAMGMYTAVLPLFLPMPSSNTWLFSGAGALSAMGFPAQTMTIAIVNGTVQASDTRLASMDDIPTALKNPNALTIKIGGTTVTYDGSAAKTVTIADGTEVSY